VSRDSNQLPERYYFASWAVNTVQSPTKCYTLYAGAILFARESFVPSQTVLVLNRLTFPAFSDQQRAS